MPIGRNASGWASDARYAMRGLCRAPLFAIVALATLAVGTGANTAVFSVVNGVLLEPLPYPGSEELVSVNHIAPGAGLSELGGRLGLSASMFFTYAEENRTFEHFGVWDRGTASVTGVGDPEQVDIVGMSDGVLASLAVPTAIGRPFGTADHDAGAAPTAVLAYDYWQGRFGGDPAVVGRTLAVDGVTTEIIGVMPRGFRVVDTAPDLLLPLRFDRAGLMLPPFNYYAVARLRPGVALEEAAADVARMLPIWMDSWPTSPAQVRFYSEVWRIAPQLLPLKHEVIGSIGNVLWVVMGTIGAVFLIVCVNVTNLLLVRAEGRRRELAVRGALGAGRWRIGRALLLESLALGLGGGILGFGIAWAGIELLVALDPGSLPRLHEVALDVRAAAFGFGLSVLSGLSLGAVLALKHATSSLGSSLQTGGRRASAGRETGRAQSVLVVVQVALALVLLVASGLMLRTFDAMRSVDPGFTDAEQLQTLRISIPAAFEPDPERVLQTHHAILDALAAIPGVSAAGFASAMPMDGFSQGADVIYAEGQRQAGPDSAQPLRRFKHVSPGFLDAAGTRLVAGRDLTWNDLYGRRPVVLVSENLASELWGAPQAALGRRITTGADFFEVVGVVQDVRDNGLREPPPAIVYWPPLLENFVPTIPILVRRTVTVVVRSPLTGTEALTRDVQRAVWSVNANLPVASMRTMQEVLDESMARTSFTLVMLGIAGAVALTLGVVGLYGVLSYVVAQRRRDIAIRLALGAQQRAVRQSYVGYGLVLTGIGVALGAGVAAGVTRLMASLLFEVRPLDAPTYAAVAVLLTAAASLASYLPARGASSVDPAEALGAE